MSTKIEWVRNQDGSQGVTWNPVAGCSKVSEGCQNCYAEKMAYRLHMMAEAAHKQSIYHTVVDNNGRWTGKTDRDETVLMMPTKWRKPRTIFVCSMSDLFYEHISTSFVHDIYDVMGLCRQHTFIVLTKRPERIIPVLYDSNYYGGGDYLPNVWHLVTAENQEMADKRIPELLKLREASEGWPVLGVSIEPMLSEIHLANFIDDIDWIIMGAESGHGARPMQLEWACYTADQCYLAEVPLFYKQGPDDKGQWSKMPFLYGRTWSQMPEVKP